MSAISWRARHLNTPPRALHLADSKHSTKLAKLLSSQGLGENICNLLLYVDICQVNVACQDPLSDEVIVDLYVFGPCMEHWVPSQRYATKIVTIYDNIPIHCIPKSSSSLRNQATSHAATTTPLSILCLCT